MAVIAAVEFDSDTLIGGAVVTAELDLETGLGRSVEALTTELDLDMGCGGCVGVGVVEDERMVAVEFAREREGRACDSWLLELEGAPDNGDDD